MTSRKRSPLHDFWHPRVEGQIRHTIGRHPEWFNLPIKTSAKRDCINSLAKRIVGEIVAALGYGGGNAGRHDGFCAPEQIDADAPYVSRRKGRRLRQCVASPMELTWYDAEIAVPEKGGATPYLIAYETANRRRIVTTAVWAGPKKGWVFLVRKLWNAKPERVKYWAAYPTPPSN